MRSRLLQVCRALATRPLLQVTALVNRPVLIASLKTSPKAAFACQHVTPIIDIVPGYSRQPRCRHGLINCVRCKHGRRHSKHRHHGHKKHKKRKPKSLPFYMKDCPIKIKKGYMKPCKTPKYCPPKPCCPECDPWKGTRRSCEAKRKRKALRKKKYGKWRKTTPFKKVGSCPPRCKKEKFKSK